MKELSICIKSADVLKNRFGKGIISLAGIMMLLFAFSFAAISWAETEYDALDVDSPPKIIRQMPVTYPVLAKRNGTEGHVTVHVLINTKGKASKMEIVESEPEGVFDEAALKSLKYWQFRPGILGGKLVPTWVKIPLTFKVGD